MNPNICAAAKAASAWEENKKGQRYYLNSLSSYFKYSILLCHMQVVFYKTVNSGKT